MVYRADKLAEVFWGRAVDMTGEGNEDCGDGEVLPHQILCYYEVED